MAKTAAATLKAHIDRGFVLVRFVQSRGATELGVKLDQTACDTTRADFDTGKGVVRLEADLTLDGARARCVVELDLATLGGVGQLFAPGEESG